MWETIILDFDEFGEEAFEFSRFEAGDWDLDVYQDGDQWRVSAARSEVEVELEQLTATSETAAKRAAINWLLDRISNQLKALVTAHAMLFEANPAPPAVVEDDPDPFELWVDEWFEDDSVLPWGED